MDRFLSTKEKQEERAMINAQARLNQSEIDKKDAETFSALHESIKKNMERKLTLSAAKDRRVNKKGDNGIREFAAAPRRLASDNNDSAVLVPTTKSRRPQPTPNATARPKDDGQDSKDRDVSEPEEIKDDRSAFLAPTTKSRRRQPTPVATARLKDDGQDSEDKDVSEPEDIKDDRFLGPV